MNAFPQELLTDRYQLTMAGSYLAQGTAGDATAFELFVRELPPDRGYLVAAGLESALGYLTDLRFGEPALEYLAASGTCPPQLIELLRGFRFEGDVDAVVEGTAIFAGEPLLRVEGTRLECQLVESALLNLINFQTLIATKAARIVGAADGRPVVDFGFRRAHGGEAGVLAARSAYIGGAVATATVAAGFAWGIPTSGTMSHSYVMGFPSELDAFCAFLRDQPDAATLLIDTFETEHGAALATEAATVTGIAPQAVRLDSGDLSALSRRVRSILDEGGLADTGILCSGDLDEYSIARLVADGAPIDGFGAGTRLVTGGDVPALGGVYKMVESAGRAVMKTSHNKATLPGRHQVFRGEEGDVIGLADEQLPGRPLLAAAARDGARVADPEPLERIRMHAATELAALPDRVRELRDPATVPTALSPRLQALRDSLR